MSQRYRSDADLSVFFVFGCDLADATDWQTGLALFDFIRTSRVGGETSVRRASRRPRAYALPPAKGTKQIDQIDSIALCKEGAVGHRHTPRVLRR